ncbi:MAG: hypothetical protein WAK48_31330 [Candidatus Acidiferrum sp.]|jgi:hypothetical protein
MDKNSRDPVHCWLVWGKAFHAAAKYLYAGLEETRIDDTDFRILEVLLTAFDDAAAVGQACGLQVLLRPFNDQ